MGPGSAPLPALHIDSSGLADVSATANVAFDIFADRHGARAGNARTAETEIMIWLGSFGSAQPLGFTAGRTCLESTLGNTTLQVACPLRTAYRCAPTDFHSILYRGRNQRGTDVLTWVATVNVTDFAAEVSPLLQSLWRNELVSPASHVGLVEFGSEAFHSARNVTFSASNFSIRLATGPAPMLDVGQLPSTCSPASSVSLHNQASWLSRMSIIGTVTAALYIL